MKRETYLRSELRVATLGILVSLVCALPACGTALQKLSLNELTAYADMIVVGKCEKVETIWLEKRIFTVATIRVSQSAKGQTATDATIDVYELGGVVDKPLPVRMYVPGAATFSQGEEAVLFLEKFGNKKQFHRLVGMRQGKVPVTSDPKTGKKRVHYGEPIKGVQWVDKNGKPVAPDVAGGKEVPTEPDDLDGFLGRIHKLKAEQESAAKKGGAR